MALDLILTGDVVGAADVLAQRFKAVEQSHADGNWSAARHYELIPEAGVTATRMKERRRALKCEREDQRWKNSLAPRRADGGGKGGGAQGKQKGGNAWGQSNRWIAGYRWNQWQGRGRGGRW